MKVRIILTSLLVVASLFSAGRIYATETSSAGFIPKNIWYSKDPLIEGDTVKVYTIVFNTEKSPLSGTVTFYDGNSVLGTRQITVTGEEFQSVSVNWTVTAGDHTIEAILTDTKIATSSGGKSITLSNTTTGKDERFVAKKIVPVAEPAKGSTPGGTSSVVDSATNTITALAQSEPVTGVTSGIEKERQVLAASASAHQEKAKAEIAALDASGSNEKVSRGQVLGASAATPNRAFSYIKVFFWRAASFIFNHKFIFYPLVILIAFAILRFLYRLIFR